MDGIVNPGPTRVLAAEPPNDPVNTETIVETRRRDERISTSVGEMFGDYLILGTIARGGMGVVFRARQIRLNRLVALKMILSSHLATKEDIQRFHAEAEAAARLDHPGIVPIYEVGELKGQHFFSMGLVEGGSLAALIAEHPLEPKKAAGLAKSIAEAVQYAHSRNIVHRDLKPANILLDSDGNPRVADFGLAKNIEQDSGLTASGQVMGTPAYMSPEQASGHNQQVGPLADVYSLGAILYCLITGKPPFRGANVIEILRRVIEDEPVSPRQLNPKIDADLATIALKCLSKDPLRRYGSAGELADELSRYLTGLPIQARAASQSERIWRWCRRNPIVSVLGFTSAMLLVAATTIATIGYSREVRLGDNLKDALQKQTAAATDAKNQAKIADGERDLAVKAREEAAAQRATAQLRLSEAYFDRALTMYDKGEIQNGLLVLAKSLKELPPGYPDLAEAIQTSLFSWSDEISAIPVQCFDSPLVPTTAGYFPDGQRVAVGCRDGSVAIWDLSTGNVRTTAMSHDSEAVRIAVSPDGTRLIVGCMSGMARLWDVATEQPIGPVFQHARRASSVAFTPDGKLVITGSWDQSRQVHRTDTGGTAYPPFGCPDYVFHLLPGPDNQSVYAADQKNIVTLREISSGNAIRQYSVPASCDTFDVSRDGGLIGMGARDNTFRVLSIESGQPVGQPNPVRGWASSISFNQNSTCVACASRDLSVQLFDCPSILPIGTSLLHRAAVDTVRFAPANPSQFLTVSPGQLRVWSRRVHALEQVVAGPTRSLEEIAIAPPAAGSNHGTQVLVKVGYDVLMRVDLATTKPVGQPQRFRKPVAGIKIDRERSRLFLLFVDKGVQMVDLQTLEPVSNEFRLDQFTEPFADPYKNNITSFALHPDGDRFAISKNYAALLLSLSQAKPLGEWLKHPNNVSTVDFTPDGQYLLTACQDGLVRIWDSSTGSPVTSFDVEAGGIRSMRLSHDGALLGLCGGGKLNSVWDLKSRKRVAGPFEVAEPMRIVDFHPDSKLFAVGGGVWSDEGKFKHHLRIWNVPASRPASRVYELPHNLTDAHFSPDGAWLLTTCEDGSLRIWKTPQPIDESPDLIEAWIEQLTGVRLDDRNTAQFLDGPGLKERQTRTNSSLSIRQLRMQFADP